MSSSLLSLHRVPKIPKKNLKLSKRSRMALMKTRNVFNVARNVKIAVIREYDKNLVEFIISVGCSQRCGWFYLEIYYKILRKSTLVVRFWVRKKSLNHERILILWCHDSCTFTVTRCFNNKVWVNCFLNQH